LNLYNNFYKNLIHKDHGEEQKAQGRGYGRVRKQAK